MYGRGTADNKAQMFAHIKAVESIVRTGSEIPLNLKFMFDPEEEMERLQDQGTALGMMGRDSGDNLADAA